MARPLQQLDLDRVGTIFCVRLRKREMNEDDLHQFGEEISRLIQEEGCRKMILNLGPDGPLCLYSIFLAKLVGIRRRLEQVGGVLKLAQVAPEIRTIFEACRLQDLFEFCPDQATAVAELSR